MSEMQAGIEMDGLVAEKVMGGEINREFCTVAVKERVGYTGLELISIGGIHPYSTDIKAAWEVREHMKKNSFYGYINDCGSWYGALFSKTTVDENGEHQQEGYAREKTAPLAICRAALKALGVS